MSARKVNRKPAKRTSPKVAPDRVMPSRIAKHSIPQLVEAVEHAMRAMEAVESHFIRRGPRRMLFDTTIARHRLLEALTICGVEPNW